MAKIIQDGCEGGEDLEGLLKRRQQEAHWIDPDVHQKKIIQEGVEAALRTILREMLAGLESKRR